MTTPDPFDLLGVPPAFPPDAGAIERAWLAASAKLHPDRAADPEAAARELAAINQARAVLTDPESAAGALLARLGGAAPDADKTLPDGLLMEMLEARDRLEEARGNAQALAEIDTWARERRAEHIAQVTALFERAQAAAPSPEQVLTDIRVQLNAWRYVERFLEQLHD